MAEEDTEKIATSFGLHEFMMSSIGDAKGGNFSKIPEW